MLTQTDKHDKLTNGWLSPEGKFYTSGTEELLRCDWVKIGKAGWFKHGNLTEQQLKFLKESKLL